MDTRTWDPPPSNTTQPSKRQGLHTRVPRTINSVPVEGKYAYQTLRQEHTPSPRGGPLGTCGQDSTHPSSTCWTCPPHGRGNRPRGDKFTKKQQHLRKAHMEGKKLEKEIPTYNSLPTLRNLDLQGNTMQPSLEKSGMENKGEPPALSQSNGFNAIGSH